MLLRIGKVEYLQVDDFRFLSVFKDGIRPLSKRGYFLFRLQLAIFYIFSLMYNNNNNEMGKSTAKIFKGNRTFELKFCGQDNTICIFADHWNFDWRIVGKEVIENYFSTDGESIPVSPKIRAFEGRIGLEVLNHRVTLEKFNKNLFFDLCIRLQKKHRTNTSYKSIIENLLDNGYKDNALIELMNDISYFEVLNLEQRIGVTHGDTGVWNIYEQNERYILIDWEFSQVSVSLLFDVIYFSLSREVLFNKCTNTEMLLGRVVLFCFDFFNYSKIHKDRLTKIIYIELIIMRYILKTRQYPEDILSIRLGEVIDLMRKRRLDNDLC